MDTPICDPRLLVTPATSGEALAALDEAQRQIVAGEVAQLVAMTHLADLWTIDSSVVAEGMECLIQPGHDGTPKVGEFVALEVGALLGVSPSLALARIGEALDLRARHPRLWQAVIAGEARVWQATKVSSECAQLSSEAALKVDEAMATSIGMVPFSRVLKALPGQIVAADTALARERADAARASRRIRVSKIQDGAMSIFGIVDPADGINFDRLLTEVAAVLPVRPDTALCTDLDRRRNLAFSMLVRDAHAKAHGEQPLFELRSGELVPLPPGRLIGVRQDASRIPLAAEAPLPRGPRLPVADLRARAKAGRQALSPACPETGPQWPGRLRFDIPVVEPTGCLKTLDGHSPPVAEPTRADGPVLYDTPVSEQLAGIAGAPNPVTHTLVVHISADDPALSSPTTPRATGVARIEGWGPLLTEQLPAFLAGSKVTVRPVIDPAGLRPVDSYETPDRMRFAIEQRNPVDVFPYGIIAANRCDMDHSRPYADGRAGQTHPGNLGPLSRTTHRAKTHGGWKLEQPEPGVYHWTSPHGYQYQVTATGTTRIHAPTTADCAEASRWTKSLVRRVGSAVRSTQTAIGCSR